MKLFGFILALIVAQAAYAAPTSQPTSQPAKQPAPVMLTIENINAIGEARFSVDLDNIRTSYYPKTDVLQVTSFSINPSSPSELVIYFDRAPNSPYFAKSELRVLCDSSDDAAWVLNKMKQSFSYDLFLTEGYLKSNGKIRAKNLWLKDRQTGELNRLSNHIENALRPMKQEVPKVQSIIDRLGRRDAERKSCSDPIRGPYF